jgi:hypothetical protein
LALTVPNPAGAAFNSQSINLQKQKPARSVCVCEKYALKLIWPARKLQNGNAQIGISC